MASAPPPSAPHLENNKVVNQLIGKYRARNKIIRLLLIALLTISAVYLIYVFASNKTVVSDIANILPEGTLAVQGNMVAFSVKTNNYRKIYISEDSGKTFYTAADSFPILDTTAYIAFTANNTLVVVEANGLVRSKQLSADHFITGSDSLSKTEKYIRGIARVPGTDSVFLYGNFGFFVALDANNPGKQNIWAMLGQQYDDFIISMDVAPDHSVKCLVHGTSGYRLLSGSRNAAMLDSIVPSPYVGSPEDSSSLDSTKH